MKRPTEFFEMQCSRCGHLWWVEGYIDLDKKVWRPWSTSCLKCPECGNRNRLEA